jgi:hypothetical protein
MGQIAGNGDIAVVDGGAAGRAQAGQELGVAVRLGVVLTARLQGAGPERNAQDVIGPGGRRHGDGDDYAGENIGTGGPPSSVALKLTRTACPMRMVSRSQSTMLVIIVGPSASVT